MLNFLVSYPKSGNTWVRIFLDAYFNDDLPDLNNIRSSWGDDFALHHAYLSNISMSKYPTELQLLGRHMSLLRIDWILKDQFPHLVKSHNSNIVVDTVRLFPPQIINKALYIVRDPRDLCISFAKHFGKTIDDTIIALGDFHYGMKADRLESSEKVTSYLSSWNNHVASWATSTDLNVSIVKYEDMLDHTEDSFVWILKWLEIPINKARLNRAIKNSQFSKLQKIEEEVGFKEKSLKADRFFSKGKYGYWKETLTLKQSDKIVEICRPMMEVLGYIDKV